MCEGVEVCEDMQTVLTEEHEERGTFKLASALHAGMTAAENTLT